MEVISSLRLPAKIENLRHFINSVTGCAKKQGFDHLRISEVELCAEEALVNVFNYAYKGGEGDAELICKAENDAKFIIEIVDYGVPFDIKTIANPDLNADISERKIGGLGVYFIQKLMDEVEYRRDGDKNILTFTVYKKRT